TSLTEIMHKKSQHLPGFTDWYRQNVSERMSLPGSDWSILTRMRIRTTHRDALKLHALTEEIPFSLVTGDPGKDDWLRRLRYQEYRQQARNPFYRRPSRSVMPGQQVKEYKSRWFFPAIQDRDAVTVCVQHYQKLKTLVDQFIKLFLS